MTHDPTDTPKARFDRYLDQAEREPGQSEESIMAADMPVIRRVPYRDSSGRDSIIEVTWESGPVDGMMVVPPFSPVADQSSPVGGDRKVVSSRYRLPAAYLVLLPFLVLVFFAGVALLASMIYFRYFGEAIHVNPPTLAEIARDAPVFFCGMCFGGLSVAILWLLSDRAS